MHLVWVGPGVLKGTFGTIYPGDRLTESRHTPQQVREWLAEGKAEYRR